MSQPGPYNTTQVLTATDLAIILACMKQVTVTDNMVAQEELRGRFRKVLKKMHPEGYQKLMEEGNI